MSSRIQTILVRFVGVRLSPHPQPTQELNCDVAVVNARSFLYTPWMTPSAQRPKGMACRRQVGARDRPDRTSGTGKCRKRGPEDASSEGTRLKSNRFRFDFSQARNLRGDFLWVLSLFAQGKYLVGRGRNPAFNRCRAAASMAQR